MSGAKREVAAGKGFSYRLYELRPKNWTQKQRFLVNSRARGLLGGPLVLELDRGQECPRPICLTVIKPVSAE